METQGKRRSQTIVASALALLVLLAAFALAACGGSSTTAASSPSTAPSMTPSESATPLPAPTVAGTLSFAKVSGGYGDIFVVRADGTGLTRLTASSASEEQSAWSPDARKIAYMVGNATTSESSCSIRVMKADGSGSHRLVRGAVAGEAPAWSPDGTKVAFSRFMSGDDSFDLVIVGANGKGLRKVTSGHDDLWAAWAPDGTIYFLRVDDEDPQVYSVEPGGSRPTRVTRLAYVAGFALSPDGKRLALYDFANDRLVLLPANGDGKPVMLVTEVSNMIDMTQSCHVRLAWSPDGKAIAFAASVWNPTGSALYIVNADGSGLSTVPNTGEVREPAWRPE
ncbi:MAG: LpqB family beta-propeller domain-containing protein [Actinobacteria bacterium]|nr:LpqB family beta-propeller domain-containing protein [Actinomycetota bacterium]